MKNLSRRGLLKGALGVGAAAAGSRIVGPWMGEAWAAPETSHFVHIFFHGGLNALFSGCAQILRGKFTTDDNIVAVGNDVYTDKDTFGTFPQFALDHFAGIGFRHGDANHTVPENANAGGELAVVRNGTTAGATCFLNELAAAMGGTSKLKAVLMGQRSQNYGVYKGNWPVVKDANGVEVPLEHLVNIREALKISGAEAPDANAPDRGRLAASIEASEAISQRHLATNPGRLGSLASAYQSAVASLREPPPPPVTFDEVNEAYGLEGQEAIVPGRVKSYAAMLAGAEILIRATNTNVIHLSDFEPMWDFDSAFNAQASREAFRGMRGGWGKHDRISAIRTFLERMLNFPGKNVVVAISGEFVREAPNGNASFHGHGNGTVAAVFGKYVKRGLSYPCSDRAMFSANTPGSKGFWAGIASALRVPGQPFGPNPHALLG